MLFLSLPTLFLKVIRSNSYFSVLFRKKVTYLRFLASHWREWNQITVFPVFNLIPHYQWGSIIWETNPIGHCSSGSYSLSLDSWILNIIPLGTSNLKSEGLKPLNRRCFSPSSLMDWVHTIVLLESIHFHTLNKCPCPK